MVLAARCVLRTALVMQGDVRFLSRPPAANRFGMTSLRKTES